MLFSPTDQMKIDTVIGRLREQAAELGTNGVLLQMTGASRSG